MVHHEIRVLLDETKLVAVQSLGDGSHEFVDVAIRCRELGNPNRFALASVVNLLDVVQEEVRTVITSRSVPMGSAEVNLALAAARVKELVKPVDTHARIFAAGNGRRADLDPASILVHELLVTVRSILGRHVGLTRDIRLVEAEETVGSRGNSSFGLLIPVVRVVRRGRPEHRVVSNLGL